MALETACMHACVYVVYVMRLSWFTRADTACIYAIECASSLCVVYAYRAYTYIYMFVYLFAPHLSYTSEHGWFSCSVGAQKTIPAYIYVCLYVCICMYVHACVLILHSQPRNHIYIRLYVCICLYMYDYVLILMHTRISVKLGWMYACKHHSAYVSMFVGAYTYTSVHMHACTYLCLCTYLCASTYDVALYLYTFVYIYIYIYIYI